MPELRASEPSVDLPMDIKPEAIVARLETILASAKCLREDQAEAKLHLFKDVEQLAGDLEPPINLFFKQWSGITVFTCLELVIRSGIFEQMKDRESISTQELSDHTGIDADVIFRIMRILMVASIVASAPGDRFSHTAKSLLFVAGEYTAIDSFDLLTLLNRSYLTIPSYITTRPTADLLDPRKSPYAVAYGMEGKTFYETISAIPGQLATFNRSMNQPGPDYGIFAFRSLADEIVANPHRAAVVDIGGGNGKALRVAKKDLEGVLGSVKPLLVLQDRPDVLDEISAEDRDGLELMPHDFHVEQPVKGAHVYTLNQILHNYADHLCVDILKKVAVSMTPESRLLILDPILPEQARAGADMMPYLIDFVGLAISGKERTEKEVTSLLEAAGLKMHRVWKPQASATGWHAVIEARL